MFSPPWSKSWITAAFVTAGPAAVRDGVVDERRRDSHIAARVVGDGPIGFVPGVPGPVDDAVLPGPPASDRGLLVEGPRQCRGVEGVLEERAVGEGDPEGQ